MKPRVIDHWQAGPALAATVLAIALLCWATLPTQVVMDALREFGPVESASVFFYLVAAAWAFVSIRRLPPGTGIAVGIVMLACAAREAQWHTDFTGTSMLRVSFYYGPASLQAKVVSLLALLPFLWAMLHLVRRYVPSLPRRWRQLQPRAVTILTFLVVLVVSKAVDRSLAILAEDFGLRGAMAWQSLQLSIEEPLELALPLLVILALAQPGAPD